MKMFEAMGGRKLVFGLLMMAAGIGLALQGKLTAETTAFLLGIYGMFAGANALTTIKAVASGAIQASEPQPAPTQVEAAPAPVQPVVEQALMALMQRQQQADANLATLQESVIGVQKAMDAIISRSQAETNRQILQNIPRQ